MPLTTHGQKTLADFIRQYGRKRGTQIFYATANSAKGGRDNIGGKPIHKEDTEMGDQFDLFDLEFDEVSFVPGGDNPESHIVLSKAWVQKDEQDEPFELTAEEQELDWTEIDDWAYETVTGFDTATGEFVFAKRQISTDQRKALRQKGQALPDLSYPVEHLGDLNNGIQAFGRAPDNKRATVKRFLKRMATKLKAPQETHDRIGNLSLAKSDPVSLSGWVGKNQKKIRKREPNGTFRWSYPPDTELTGWIKENLKSKV
jgi:hypothetical protein